MAPPATNPTTSNSPTTPATTGADRSALAGVIPYLAVRDAAAAIDWYVSALGAQLLGEPIVMPDGRIGHAELSLAGGGFMLAEEHPEIGHVAPDPTGNSVSIHAEVTDVDTLVARAADAGATVFREPADYPYGRGAGFRDPYGHRWLVNGPTRVTDPIRQGDIVYVSLWVPDDAAATRFFSDVLGWRYDRSAGPDRPTVAGALPSHGFAGGVTPPTMMLCLTVDDIEAATDRVRAAGGTTGTVREAPWGATVDCTDDQGMRFALHQAPPQTPAAARPATTAMGDVTYLTILTPDSVRLRAFFSAVVGWAWNAGRIDDGWEPVGTWPMTGMAGGHRDDPGVLPMYRVPDIAAAVERVRALGGTATEPEEQPYGITAECRDDQGTRFYLGQLPD